MSAGLRRAVAAALVAALAAGCERERAPARAEAPAAPRASDAAAVDLVAVDLLVVVHATTVVKRWGRDLELAPALKARVAPYENRVQMTLGITGVDDSVTADGARTTIPPEGAFAARLAGEIAAVVAVRGGEVGVVAGEVHVSDGAIATVDDRSYRRVGGRWVAER